MPSFNFAFNAASPAVQSPDFEEKLALKLLDAMLGRQMACFPEPVPLTQDGGNTRMIGHSNNFWLIRDEADAGHYRLASRYDGDDSRARMEKARSMIAAEYGDAVVKMDEVPASKPATPRPPRPF